MREWELAGLQEVSGAQHLVDVGECVGQRGRANALAGAPLLDEYLREATAILRISWHGHSLVG